MGKLQTLSASQQAEIAELPEPLATRKVVNPF
jgi:hypothetical protein